MARKRAPVPELHSLRSQRKGPGLYEQAVLREIVEVAPMTMSNLPENHVSILCICTHSKQVHYSTTFGEPCSASKPDGTKCTCERFNTVSKTSRHAYQRGMKTAKKRVVDLQPGDRVLTGWTTWAGRIKLLTSKTGAMVSTVRLMERHRKDGDWRDGGDWRSRCWLVTTDLGQSFPKAGGDVVLVVTDRAS